MPKSSVSTPPATQVKNQLLERILVVSLMVGSAAIGVSFALMVSRTPVAEVQRTPTLQEKISSASTQLKSLQLQYATASTGSQELIADQMQSIATQRAVNLKTLAATDAQSTFALFFSPADVAAFPDAVQDALEEPSQFTGKSVVTIAEDFAKQESTTLVALDVNGKTYPLRIVGTNTNPVYTSGLTVQTSGVLFDGQLYSTPTTTNITSFPPASDTLGEQKTLVLLTQPTGATLGAPWNSPDYARGLFATNADSLDHYIRENSFNKTWFTVDVKGVYQLSVAAGNCGEYLQAAFDSPQVNSQVTWTSYSRIVIVYPSTPADTSNCGSRSSRGKQTMRPNGVEMQASNTKIRATDTGYRIVYHEMGHALGIGEQGTQYCGTEALGVSCEPHHYHDPYSRDNKDHFNVANKHSLNWLQDNQVVSITPPVSNARYTITPLETETGLKTVRIPRRWNGTTPDAWYYIQYRQPIGYDADINRHAPISSGVLLTYGVYGAFSETSDTRLLDTTPSTPYRDTNFYDAMLLPGKTVSELTDDYLYTIKLVSVNASGATVEVSMVDPDTIPYIVDVGNGAGMPGQWAITVPVNLRVAATAAPVRGFQFSFPERENLFFLGPTLNLPSTSTWRKFSNVDNPVDNRLEVYANYTSAGSYYQPGTTTKLFDLTASAGFFSGKLDVLINGAASFLRNSSGNPIANSSVLFLDGAIAENTARRGDLNLNGTHNEISDLILYQQCRHIMATASNCNALLTVNAFEQTAQSDVNGDCLYWTDADLVVLEKIVTGEIQPIQVGSCNP